MASWAESLGTGRTIVSPATLCSGRLVKACLKDMGMTGLASAWAMARRKPKGYSRKMYAVTRSFGTSPHTWPDLTKRRVLYSHFIQLHRTGAGSIDNFLRRMLQATPQYFEKISMRVQIVALRFKLADNASTRRPSRHSAINTRHQRHSLRSLVFLPEKADFCYRNAAFWCRAMRGTDGDVIRLIAMTSRWLSVAMAIRCCRLRIDEGSGRPL